MSVFKATLLIFLNVVLAAALLVFCAERAAAQVDGSCWEVKSNLKKAKRYVCAAENNSPFRIPIDQNRILRQLKQFRPLTRDLVLERGEDHNRTNGNSRLERIEKNGVPLASALGAFGVYGSGPVTAGISAVAPIVVPAIRKWFHDASKPLWSEPEQLLSDKEIIMEPGSSANFWFYAEKGGQEGEFRILPLEMGVVESALQARPVTFSNLSVEDPTVQNPVRYDVHRVSYRPTPQPPPPPAAAPSSEPEFRYYLRTIAK